MREQWLAETYRKIKQARDTRWSRALTILREKATRDPEVAEALRLLRPWGIGQAQEEVLDADDTSGR